VWLLTGLLSLVALAAWPALGGWVKDRALSGIDSRLQPPSAAGGWAFSPDLVDSWKPDYTGYDDQLTRTYRKGDRRVGLYLVYYGAQRQGAELVNASNRIVKRGIWNTESAGEYAVVPLSGTAIDVTKTALYSADHRLLVYQWNWFDGSYLSSPYEAKLLELKRKLMGKPLPAAAIMVYTGYTDDKEAAGHALQAFINDMQPSIERALDETAGRHRKSQ
jgi:EpsI family protein